MSAAADGMLASSVMSIEMADVQQADRRLLSVPERVLTETLRTLEVDGLVVRTVFDENPPRVEYQLSTLGESLLGSLQGLRNWAVEHVEDIHLAQQQAATRVG